METNQGPLNRKFFLIIIRSTSQEDVSSHDFMPVIALLGRTALLIYAVLVYWCHDAIFAVFWMQVRDAGGRHGRRHQTELGTAKQELWEKAYG